MFSWFKKKKATPEQSTPSQKRNYDFRWYEIGEENPFNKRILDIRNFTGNMTSTTSDLTVAEKFTQLRRSNGEEYIGQHVADSATVSVSLKYPHNGAALHGIVFKAKEMECKWDIYIYDDIFYFTRSWTGNLLFKATAKINADSIEITSIEYPSAEDQDLSISNVHFLIMSHALGRVFPHMVPPISSNEDIALYSFSTFGNRACYATFDTIVDTVVATKK